MRKSGIICIVTLLLETINDVTLNKQIDYLKKQHQACVKGQKSYVSAIKQFAKEIHYCFPNEENVEILGKNGAMILLNCAEHTIYAKKVNESDYTEIDGVSGRFFRANIESIAEQFLK